MTDAPNVGLSCKAGWRAPGTARGVTGQTVCSNALLGASLQVNNCRTFDEEEGGLVSARIDS